MARVPIPPKTQFEVATKSGRRCALCYFLDGVRVVVAGQLAHVDRDNTNPEIDNLAFLCMKHHDQYDSKTSQSKGFLPDELREYRARLYEAVERGEHLRSASPPTAATPAASDPDARAYDRTIFQGLSAILDETELTYLLDRIDSDHAYRMARWMAIMRLLDHARLESNRFHDDDLQVVADGFLAALKALDDFVTVEFFIYGKQPREDDDSRLCMRPEWNVDRGGTGNAQQSREYFELADRLHELVEATRASYREFRRHVRKTLLV